MSLTGGNNMIVSDIVSDASISNRIERANGFMTIKNNVLSSGVVSPYLGRQIPGAVSKGFEPDKIYGVLRDPVELEKAADSFEGLPLLLGHKIITSKDIRQAPTVGAVTNIIFDSNNMKGTLHIHAQEAIDLLNSKDENEKISDISCAYKFTPVFEKGFHQGKEYDVRMTNIIGNHVALVKSGRVESAVVADESINVNKGKSLMTQGVSVWAKLLGYTNKKSGVAQDAGFTEMDVRSMMRDIEASDMGEDSKNQRVKELMARMTDTSVDKVLEGQTDNAIAKDEDDTKDDSKSETKSEPKESKDSKDSDDKSETGIVDNTKLEKMIEDKVTEVLKKMHQAADYEEKENGKAMDEAIGVFKSLHGTPNVESFKNDPKNVYKAILDNRGIACDHMDLDNMKVAVSVLSQTGRSTYVQDSAPSQKTSSIFDDPLLQKRKVK